MRTFIIVALTLLVGVACSRDAEETPQPTVAAIPTTAVSTPATSEPTASTSARLVVEGGQGAAGEVIPVEIALYDAVDGVSGYAIQVSSANPQVARISNVRLPEYGLSMVGDVPAESVDITAVDLSGLLEGAFTRETLATLDVELLSSGQTRILLELHLLDDDRGNVLVPDVVSGDLLVN